jgi:hypothetical protein
MFILQNSVTKYYFDGRYWNKSYSYAKVYNKATAIQIAKTLTDVQFLNANNGQVTILN